jgi:hypothetical protein
VYLSGEYSLARSSSISDRRSGLIVLPSAAAQIFRQVLGRRRRWCRDTSWWGRAGGAWHPELRRKPRWRGRQQSASILVLVVKYEVSARGAEVAVTIARETTLTHAALQHQGCHARTPSGFSSSIECAVCSKFMWMCSVECGTSDLSSGAPPVLVQFLHDYTAAVASHTAATPSASSLC